MEKNGVSPLSFSFGSNICKKYQNVWTFSVKISSIIACRSLSEREQERLGVMFEGLKV